MGTFYTLVLIFTINSGSGGVTSQRFPEPYTQRKCEVAGQTLVALKKAYDYACVPSPGAVIDAR